MTACGTDYLSKDWISRSYVLVYSIFCYFLPLLTIVYSYFFIVQAVAAHESNMREQAKKMNVTSLRAEDKAQSAECKLAKVIIIQLSFNIHAYRIKLFLLLDCTHDHFIVVLCVDALFGYQLHGHFRGFSHHAPFHHLGLCLCQSECGIQSDCLRH
jgi:7 transmembrane receptor (rhodopsin family)